MPINEASFGSLMHGTMDVEEPNHGWLRLQCVLAVPGPADYGSARCLDVSATDEAGVVIALAPDEIREFGGRFVLAFLRGGGRGIHEDR